MKGSKSPAISIQKQVKNQNIDCDSEIDRAFKELKIRSLLNQCVSKNRGFSVVEILFLLVLLPFLKSGMTGLWNSTFLENLANAGKDTFYRLLNNERFNWRKFVYSLAIKVIVCAHDVPLKEKVLIADDSVCRKTGKKIELVSYNYDHKEGRTVLGHQYLQLGIHNGINFFPLDVAMSVSGKRPNTRERDIDKRTNGAKRRKEAHAKKTDNLVEMVRRAKANGIDAAALLIDSWYAYDSIIHKVYKAGYNSIARLKQNHVKYEYRGKNYTLKQLWRKFAKKQTVLIHKHSFKAATIRVRLPKTGDVSITFVSDGSKKWIALLATAISLKSSEIIDYYKRRWSIEVFFKDAKQMLYMGKEQSQTFDATIACHSIVMVRYLLLVYILNKRGFTCPIGPLFNDLCDTHILLAASKVLWDCLKDFLFTSSHIKNLEISPQKILKLIEIIENNFIPPDPVLSAKL